MIATREPFSVDLLYGDHEGGQRTITRFSLIPTADSWLASITRHWYLDWDGPRPEHEIRAAVDAVQYDREAAEQRAAQVPVTTVAADAEGTVTYASATTETEGPPGIR